MTTKISPRLNIYDDYGEIIYSIPGDKVTLRNIAAEIRRYLEKETKAEIVPPPLDLIKRAASDCPRCGGEYFHNAIECERCEDYIRYISSNDGGRK